jgi:hypothetical protein
VAAVRGVAFMQEGAVRPIGTSTYQTTVFPVWWWIVMLAVASYVGMINIPTSGPDRSWRQLSRRS